MNKNLHYLHANCLRLEDFGLLIMGETGSGKSTITLGLIERAHWSGREAILISDDYTNVTVRDGFLNASTPENIRGAIEIRGAGIFSIDYQDTTNIDYVIQLGENNERFPDSKKFIFENVEVPMLDLPSIRHADGLALCHAIEAFCFGSIWNKSL